MVRRYPREVMREDRLAVATAAAALALTVIGAPVDPEGAALAARLDGIAREFAVFARAVSPAVPRRADVAG